MIRVKSFTFGPFAENTYVLWDDTRECIIIDPGCFGREEEEKLRAFIAQEQLKPVRLINTHCHLDHVFGNPFVVKTWGLGLEMHRADIPVLERFTESCQLFGVGSEALPQPEPAVFIEEGEKVTFGNSTLDVLFTPGHSPGSISFYSAAHGFIISGDVLFQGSIGRTDLPGGNFDVLIHSIRSQFFPLPDDTTVYSGHGPKTTIGAEKKYNPFLAT